MKRRPVKRVATPRHDGSRWNENKGRGFKPKPVAAVSPVTSSTSKPLVRILVGDVRERLKDLPDESVHCVVTSPPYFGLRDYGTAKWEGGDPKCDHKNNVAHQKQGKTSQRKGRANTEEQRNETVQRIFCGKCGARRVDNQIGLDATPDEFVKTMVDVFTEIRRVLRKDGTVWLNLGDSYVSTAPGTMGDPINQRGIFSGVSNDRAKVSQKFRPATPHGLKPKDLIGIPWRVVLALQADGWWLRSDIIWHKPSVMPESTTDRPTNCYEHVFLLAKSAKYFFDQDAVRMPSTGRTDPMGFGHQGGRETAGAQYALDAVAGANIRNMWSISPKPFIGAHFATFPPALVEPCIKAGTSEKGCCSKCGAPYVRIKRTEIDDSRRPARRNIFPPEVTKAGQSGNALSSGTWGHWLKSTTLGWQPNCKCDAPIALCTVLDPFGGSGTVGVVANDLRRNAILIELNPAYAKMAEDRISGFFVDLERM